MIDKIKEFKPSSWSIDNKTSIYVITILITLGGILAYNNMPKESFPDITIPKIFVSTVYPGTAPTNMENLVTKPIEKQLKGIAGVKKITSSSVQDVSNVIIEFGTDIDIPVAKQRVKDAVDKARSDLPQDLPRDPVVVDINLSDLPIMYINIAGDYDLNKLKKYADDMKDQIEGLKEISKVEIVGALEREIQVNVNMYRMQAAQISIGDIERAIGSENLNLSGGDVKMDGLRRIINIKGEFTNAEVLKNLVIRAQSGATVYLGDIAEIKDSFKEQQSYARLDGKKVITLNVVKRSGENLIEASDKIRDIISEMQKTVLPSGLKVVITGDQSDKTRSTVHDLINTIIIGFILVLLVLMFFMGVTNAFFVAVSVPLSMFIAFLIMPSIGFTMNMIVLFAFLLALGIVVDDAIVVIENTHRIYNNGQVPIVKAAKMAAGEVFLPVLSGTLTTLAPFVPLAFWGGVIGKFMFFLPITLIITLLASLVVAYIINPVFAVDFMKPHHDEDERKKRWTKGLKLSTIVFGAFALLFYVSGNIGMANFTVLLALLNLLNRFYLKDWINSFQFGAWPRFQNWYVHKLNFALRNPWKMVLATIGLFIFSIVLFSARSPKVVFFPIGQPNFVYVYIKLPIGTDQAYTNQVAGEVEKKVSKVLGKNNPLVKSVITNVTVGVTDPQDEDQGMYPNRAKIAVSFVDAETRHGAATEQYLDQIRREVKGMPGVEITVNQEQAGPPVSKPVNVEVRGDNLADLMAASTSLKHYLDSLNVQGVEELKSDLELSKPELVFDIDRERANREGISLAQAGMEIRKAVFGQDKPSKFRDANDDYPIQIRYQETQRNNIEDIKNIRITYRDMNMGGQIRSVPLSAFAEVRYEKSFGGIKRRNSKRVVSLSSNVLNGYNPNEVVAEITEAIKSFPVPEGVEIKMTGQQEEQKETSGFLGTALLISLGLIFIILVIQFNSVGKPFIILTQILFSIIGVLLGVSIFKMDMSIVMTGIGIVALAGIVVRNGILLIEFTELMKEEGMNTFEALLEAGRTRMTPVLLTATAAILGLIPLAVGMNIDFETLLTHLNPHIWFGGDNVAFWGPLSWTMIFGLSFATFLTLILVPVLYLITDKWKESLKRWRSNRKLSTSQSH